MPFFGTTVKGLNAVYFPGDYGQMAPIYNRYGFSLAVLPSIGEITNVQDIGPDLGVPPEQKAEVGDKVLQIDDLFAFNYTGSVRARKVISLTHRIGTMLVYRKRRTHIVVGVYIGKNYEYFHPSYTVIDLVLNNHTEGSYRRELQQMSYW